LTLFLAIFGKTGRFGAFSETEGIPAGTGSAKNRQAASPMARNSLLYKELAEFYKILKVQAKNNKIFNKLA
jgi:hypothetical protein